MEITLNVNSNINRNLIYSPQSNVSSIPASGGIEQIFITPAAGLMGLINSLGINIPAVSGATSGTHSLYITVGTTSAGAMVVITTPYDQPMTIQGLAVVNGTPVPSDQGAVATALSNILFDNNLPLYFKYVNNTNAAQAGSRMYNALYVIEGEQSSF